MIRLLIFIIAFTILATSTFGQSKADSLYGMTTEQNKVWLTELKMADKENQLTLIQNRFFRQHTFEKSDNDDIPVLVVDGIPISEQMDTKLKDFLAYKLTADKVQIEVLDKEPEQLYVNKRWTGLILLNITDKKTRRKMYR